MQLRKAHRRHARRAGPHFRLPLPGLPEAHRQCVRGEARFAAKDVVVAGESREYTRVGDEGTSARFRFCPECGATVFWWLDAVPGMVVIPVGAFADPQFPPPRVSVYGVRQHPWVRLTGQMEHLD
jgi:hypothetical protein